MSDNTNRGPVAPKDPTKKRPFFYIMKDKEINGWTHCNAVLLLNEEDSRQREVVVQMKDGQENRKFTILGFGVA